MSNIACIVEGHGEVEAVCILLRRIGENLDDPVYPSILPPMRIPSTRLIKKGELERAVELAARKLGRNGAILILLDCEDDCPGKLGPELLTRARTARDDRAIAVVLAKREYESWFLASAESLRGKRGLKSDITPPQQPEEIRDAKGWLSSHMEMGESYSETTDQPALTALFDMRSARATDSFDKCYREVVALLKLSAEREINLSAD